MNMIRECPTCGVPIYGSLTCHNHHCRAAIAMTLPQIPDPTPVHKRPVLDCDDTITPGEATRLCALIRDQISMHGKYCAYCQMQIASLSCPDVPAMQEALEKWEQYTLIEVDRHAK